MSEEVDFTPRCSYCRKKMPTTVDKQKMKVGPDVCICDHNWLNHTTAVLPEVVEEPRTDSVQGSEEDSG